MIRRLLCFLGWHYWQFLMAPPSCRRGDHYDPGIWCIFCNRRGPRSPGDGALGTEGKVAQDPNDARVAIEVPCG